MLTMTPIHFLLLILPSLFQLSTQADLNCTALYPHNPSTPYPNRQQICKTFSLLSSTTSSYTTFFNLVAEDVDWTIEGSHPLAGRYTNRTVLIATFARITQTGSAANPLRASLINITGGGNEEWSVEELQVMGICRNGLLFDNRYAWVTRWNTTGYIVEVRAYLDSALVAAAITGNEVGEFTYSDTRNVIIPSVTLSEQVLADATGLNKTCA